MTHSLHEGRGTVLFDECGPCTSLSVTLEVDHESLMWLAEMAAIAHLASEPAGFKLSMNERRAISQLRHMARIVFKSGITEEVAR